MSTTTGVIVGGPMQGLTCTGTAETFWVSAAPVWEPLSGPQKGGGSYIRYEWDGKHWRLSEEQPK